MISSPSQLGFFQLTDHPISSQLANSAESEALRLFDLSREQKESYFPKNNWPVGYEGEDDEEGDGLLGQSFCLDDASFSVESTEFSVSSLRELTRALEKVGLKIVESLCGAVGFDDPLGKDDPTRFCSLMWLSEDLPGKKMLTSGGFYPYIVGLQYQIRSRKYSLMGDSGWVSVSPQVDSIMVTVGDIAQVWSNGKLKKVRGRPVVASCLGEGINKNSRCISMTLLLTLPLDSRVSTLLPTELTIVSGAHINIVNEEGLTNELLVEEGDHDHDHDHDREETTDNVGVLMADHRNIRQRENMLFNSFSFEDYAWRVYHERLQLKDPLDRYRIIN